MARRAKGEAAEKAAAAAAVVVVAMVVAAVVEVAEGVARVRSRE